MNFKLRYLTYFCCLELMKSSGRRMILKYPRNLKRKCIQQLIPEFHHHNSNPKMGIAPRRNATHTPIVVSLILHSFYYSSKTYYNSDVLTPLHVSCVALHKFNLYVGCMFLVDYSSNPKLQTEKISYPTHLHKM